MELKSYKLLFSFFDLIYLKLKLTVMTRCIKFQLEKAVVLYGEDVKLMQSDEFFGIFGMFLTSLNEARLENQQFQKQREEDEKKIKRDAEV